MVGAHALPTAQSDASICTPLSLSPGLSLARSRMTPSSVQFLMSSEDHAWNTVPLHPEYPSVVVYIQYFPSMKSISGSAYCPGSTGLYAISGVFSVQVSVLSPNVSVTSASWLRSRLDPFSNVSPFTLISVEEPRALKSTGTALRSAFFLI